MFYVGVVLAIGIVAVVLLAGRAYLRASGARVVTCPDHRRPAGVELDARRAAVTAILGGPTLRLRLCSRWPEKQGCGQECLREIASSRDGCLVRGILTRWYEGKRCVACGRSIGPIDWAHRKPALLAPDGRTADWTELDPERVPEVLTTHAPVCFDCHVSETFRRMYPDLVVDRPWDREGTGPSS